MSGQHHAYFIGGPFDLTKRLVGKEPQRIMKFALPRGFSAVDLPVRGDTTTYPEDIVTTYSARHRARPQGSDVDVVVYVHEGAHWHA